MVKYLDDVVGEMIQALQDKQMWNDVLFITSSDNGGPVTTSVLIITPSKVVNILIGREVFERMHSYQGYLPEQMRGKKTEGYIHIADWYATFCALAGVDPTDERAAKANLPPIDSLNMWPLISGQNSTSPRTDIPISNATLISGDYKILTGDIKLAGWTGPVYPNNTNPQGGVQGVEHCGETGCLYNIRKDPEEYVNLAKSMPDVLNKMKSKLTEYRSTRFEPDRGRPWRPEACNAALNKYGGFWGPFLP